MEKQRYLTDPQSGFFTIRDPMVLPVDGVFYPTANSRRESENDPHAHSVVRTVADRVIGSYRLLIAKSINGPWGKWKNHLVLQDNEVYYQCGYTCGCTMNGKDYIIFHAFVRGDEEKKVRLFVREACYAPNGTETLLSYLERGEEE